MLMRGHEQPSGVVSRSCGLSSLQGHSILPGLGGGRSVRVGQRVYWRVLVMSLSPKQDTGRSAGSYQNNAHPLKGVSPYLPPKHFLGQLSLNRNSTPPEISSYGGHVTRVCQELLECSRFLSRWPQPHERLRQKWLHTVAFALAARSAPSVRALGQARMFRSPITPPSC